MRDGATTVLAIEDDGDIRSLLRLLLTRGGYAVIEAASGRQGLRIFHEARPDVVILDVGLPDLEGWDVLERIRDLSDVPVLLLTARSAEQDKVRGLELGADDYVTKPFGKAELLARLEAISRRTPPADDAPRVFDDGRLRLDFTHQQVTAGDRDVTLTPIEYRLLATLVERAGQIVSNEQLLELAWNEPLGLGTDRVKYAVLRLRRKLAWDDAESSPLESVRGFGYRYRRNE